jgi:NADH dehydrogenase
VLDQLDLAHSTHDPQTRQRSLTFVVVGGGYAGVEALAELESLARDAAPEAVADMRWVLVEAAETILPGIDHRLAAYAERQLRKQGIDVHLGTRLESCEDGIVRLSDRAISPYPSGTIVWTAGQRPSALGAESGLPVDERGRVVVDEHLAVPGVDDVFVVGDAAAVPDPEGGFAPPTAQHALREGRVAAANVAARFGVGSGQPVPFRYRTRGLAVTLGKHRGTAQVRRFTFTGPLAWWMGRSYHLLMVPGWVRRTRIVVDWTLALFFPRDVSQLGALGRPSRLPV